MADPSSLYQTVLQAVSARMAGLHGPAGWNVVLLGRPAWTPALADLSACVVAPRADLAEGVGDETLANEVFLKFDVFVGFFVDARGPAGLDQTYKRAAAREVTRLDLWKPGAPGLPAAWFDCDYDPLGMGGEQPPPNAEGSWQKFTFSVKAPRQSPPPTV